MSVIFPNFWPFWHHLLWLSENLPLSRDSMLLYAVLALASRHQAFKVGQDEEEALTYYSRCIREVIATLADDGVNYNEDLLVAIVLLRVHEELG
jgi:hypothetical protein